VTPTDKSTTLSGLDRETIRPGGATRVRGTGTVPGLTVLYHPDARRIGHEARLTSLAAGTPASLSRLEPELAAPGEAAGTPLADPYISRQPLVIEAASGGELRLVPNGASQATVDGELLDAPRLIGPAALERGVVIELGERVVLLLHTLGAPARRGPDFGIIGEDPAVVRVREQIRQVCDLDVPVLVRGETGTGKELVARAIHEHSPRRARSFVAVNMGAVPASTAASELFGHARGAFTGAVRDHAGHFVRADHGSLFLDEIGETPLDVQAMLLRVLETGELQPVGSPATRKVDVRLIAATDADLEAATAERAFRPALLHRVSGYVITLPPLRERRQDLGRLLLHFLRTELAAIGEAHRLDFAGPAATPWLPGAVVARLVGYHWPGNVRELKNVVRQLVISNRGADTARLDPALERLLARPAVERPATGMGAVPEPEGYRDPNEVPESEMIEALLRHGWKVGAAAKALRVSRTSLYALIDRSPRVRKATDIPREELEATDRRCGGDMEEMARELEVSKRALLFRLKELGLR
jgi:two-component system nitrogen regulation response regulator GlnG